MKKTPLPMIAAAMLAALAITACSAGSGGQISRSASEQTDPAAGRAQTTGAAASDSTESTFVAKKYGGDFTLPSIEAVTVGENTIHVELPTLPKLNLELGLKLKTNPYVTLDARGAISLDTSVLFDYDSAELNDKGKESLKSFLNDYVKEIFNSDGTAKVKKITVEGHTDTDGSREYNQKLSEQRAKAVMDYCNQIHPELKPYLVAKGCAYDYPVLKADGSIDMAASRRVCFVAE